MRRALRRNRGRYPGRVAAHPGDRAPCPPPPDRRSRRRPARRPGDIVQGHTVLGRATPSVRNDRRTAPPRTHGAVDAPGPRTPPKYFQPPTRSSTDGCWVRGCDRGATTRPIRHHPSARVTTRPATGAAVSAAKADVDIDRCGAYAADHATPLTAHAVDHVAPLGPRSRTTRHSSGHGYGDHAAPHAQRRG